LTDEFSHTADVRGSFYLRAMYRATFFIVLGFLLFLFGFIALILLLVGLQLSFLAFLDIPSRSFGFAMRLLMVFGGVVMMYISRSKFED